MDRHEFDRYADNYRQQHAKNVAITGEEPVFFAAYKIAAVAGLLAAAGIRPHRILDFGAGIGNSIPHFRHHFPSAQLTCADVSGKSLAIARERFPGQTQTMEIDGSRLPLEDGCVDLAFTACVFHHIQADEHLPWLAELRRVVRPGGALILFEHNPLNPLTVRAVNTCPFDANARLIRAGTMARLIAQAGWQAPRIDYRLFFPRALAWLRPLERRLARLPLGAQYSVMARRAA